MKDSEPVAYPFDDPAGLDVDDAYAVARAAGMIRVRLPYGEPVWLVTRYADARLVLSDPRFSRAMATERDGPRLTEAREEPGQMFTLDPPEHTRLRTLVAKAFTMHRVARLRPRVRELAEGLADELVAAGAPADLVEHYTRPIPGSVICEMLGVPASDRPQFQVWSDTMMAGTRVTLDEVLTAREELRDYLHGMIEIRRAEPADDLMTALIEARDEHGRLSERELIDLCLMLLMSGLETTETQLSSIVYTLLTEPHRWARLRDDPELVPSAIEELLRFLPLGTAGSFVRYATEDVAVGDTLVRAGEPVLVALAAANRDAARFDAPDEVRLARRDNSHLGFGHGAHHCLGAQLARVELQESLWVLLARLPGLHLAGEVEWKTGMLIRGPRVLPVGW
ncbi:MAG TPA: cytochrome P450 [Actinophytocola sp.]|nr:cytochrome P450 [Actinophytocola sp.]HEV2782095.1 cytochrome P450 [Actinophytocola sp.]